MISFTQQQTIFGDLSQNTTSTNLTRAAYLANIEQRYLLQRYFNNEGTYRIQTIGGTSLAVTGQIQYGATSGTLTYAWPYPTTTAKVTFSDGEVLDILLTNSSTAITWQIPIQGIGFSTTNSIASGATTATLSTAWVYPTGSYTVAFSDGETKTVTITNGSTALSWSGGLSATVSALVNVSYIGTTGYTNLSVGGVQYYKVPPNYSKMKTVTITVGVLQWTLSEVLSREEWDNLNVFPYYASIPDRFFIYDDNTIGIWPIPSTTGNTIAFNYKFRIPDLSIADYTTPGTVSVTNGSLTVTGSGTSFQITANKQNESRWIQFAPTSSSSTSGDNLWYQIASVDSATSITLYDPYQGTTITGSSTYTIGQMPLLAEDFQDMLVWKPLIFYFSSIVKDPNQVKIYEGLYAEKMKQLDEYLGSKVVNVNLSRRSRQKNPNLFGQTFG